MTPDIAKENLRATNSSCWRRYVRGTRTERLLQRELLSWLRFTSGRCCDQGARPDESVSWNGAGETALDPTQSRRKRSEFDDAGARPAKSG